MSTEKIRTFLEMVLADRQTNPLVRFEAGRLLDELALEKAESKQVGRWGGASAETQALEKKLEAL